MFHVKPDDPGCPNGDCPHLATAHEAEAYTTDGTPVRPICVIDRKSVV
jgi:hypothetical protein